MSATTIQAYTKKTLSKALCWLEQQPKDWAHHINADTAVRLYLKAQNEEKEKKKKNSFVKELNKYCDNNTISKEEISKNSLPSAEPLNLNKEINLSFLDSKSKDLVEKTKEGLNLSSSEEALRTLLQIGYKSLKPLLSP